MADLKDTRDRGLYTDCFLNRGEHGFTLVEMLVSISILTVIMAAMFSFLMGASEYWGSAQNSAEVTANARLGLNRMTREFKQASNVTAALTNEVSFTANFGTGAETITYGYAPGENDETGTVWRSSTTSPGQVTLINDVQSLQFTYYGSDYKCDTQIADGIITLSELEACSTSPASKIARVDIDLALRAGSDSSKTFVEQAWLRNRSTTS